MVQTIPADVVVVGVGMKPRDPIWPKMQGWLSTTASGRRVRPDVLHGVFAAGDVARRLDPRSGDTSATSTGRTRAESRHGRGDSMTGNRQPFDEVPWFWSDQYGINLQTAGEPLGGDTWCSAATSKDMSFSAFSLHGDR